MNGKPLHELKVTVSGSLDIRYMEVGKNSLLVPIPDEIALAIGHIAILWGGFEQRMDASLAQVFESSRIEPPLNWRHLPFKKRKSLFRKHMTEYCRLMFPREEKVVRQVADEAGGLYWRRNVVAHAFVEIRPVASPQSPTGYTPWYVARGVHNGKDVEVSLDIETLTKLRHDISHLGGKLMAALSRMGATVSNGSPELVVADKDLLQGPPRGSFQTLAMPNIQIPQRKSYPG